MILALWKTAFSFIVFYSSDVLAKIIFSLFLKSGRYYWIFQIFYLALLCIKCNENVITFLNYIHDRIIELQSCLRKASNFILHSFLCFHFNMNVQWNEFCREFLENFNLFVVTDICFFRLVFIVKSAFYLIAEYLCHFCLFLSWVN